MKSCLTESYKLSLVQFDKHLDDETVIMHRVQASVILHDMDLQAMKSVMHSYLIKVTDSSCYREYMCAFLTFRGTLFLNNVQWTVFEKTLADLKNKKLPKDEIKEFKLNMSLVRFALKANALKTQNLSAANRIIAIGIGNCTKASEEIFHGSYALPTVMENKMVLAKLDDEYRDYLGPLELLTTIELAKSEDSFESKLHYWVRAAIPTVEFSEGDSRELPQSFFDHLDYLYGEVNDGREIEMPKLTPFLSQYSIFVKIAMRIDLNKPWVKAFFTSLGNKKFLKKYKFTQSIYDLADTFECENPHKRVENQSIWNRIWLDNTFEIRNHWPEELQRMHAVVNGNWFELSRMICFADFLEYIADVYIFYQKLEMRYLKKCEQSWTSFKSQFRHPLIAIYVRLMFQTVYLANHKECGKKKILKDFKFRNGIINRLNFYNWTGRIEGFSTQAIIAHHSKIQLFNFLFAIELPSL